MVEKEDSNNSDKTNNILKAAQKRFDHYGLSKTTMNEIADDIGMSKASLYYYFKDKESIFVAVAEKEIEYFVSEMKKIIHSTHKAEWMLLRYVSLRLELLKKLITLGKFSSGHYLEFKPLMYSILRNFRTVEIETIGDILRFGVKNGEFSVDNVKRFSEFFIDVQRGLRQSAISGGAENGMIDVPPKIYTKLKLQSRMLAEIFIKGLSK